MFLTISWFKKFKFFTKSLLKILKQLPLLRPIFYLNYLIIIIILQTTIAKADSDLDTIASTLENLTCETQGVGDLIRREDSHTCVPAPFSSYAIASIISPGLFPVFLLHLKLHDPDLEDIEDSCLRENRVDFDTREMTFYLCNNLDLGEERLEAIGDTAIAVVTSIIEGKNVWNAVKDAWNIPKEDYHTKFTKTEGDSGTMSDAPFPLPWKVIRDKDKLCVATQSFGGWIPVGCKYIKEPFPISIYADFMSVNPTFSDIGADTMALTHCSGTNGCYQRAYNNSRNAIVMTGPLIECVKEMVSKLMISNDVCSFGDLSAVSTSAGKASSSLFQFQVGMHKIVSALLTIYVILFGFKVLLSGGTLKKQEIINFALKILFVTYFSIGLNVTAGSDNPFDRLDGMIQWAFPLLLNGMTEMSSWIINASPSTLCEFSADDYPDGLAHLALWDALDCRISHYLGLDFIQTLIVDNASRAGDFSKFDGFNAPIPPYIYLLIPAVISGNPTLISLALMYPLLVISVAAFLVNATVVCIIGIVILGVLAPLFVPLFLFNYTRGYFDSWVRLLLSFMIQPAVAVVFLTAMFAIYDFGFYGTCQYNNSTITVGGRQVDVFYVDNDWDGYPSSEDAEGCQNSLGYILNNPMSIFYDYDSDVEDTAEFPWMENTSASEDASRYDFLSSIVPSPGKFFTMIEVIYEKIIALIGALFIACFALYLMYNFSSSLTEFAADISSGVNIGNMAIGAQDVFKAGMAAAGAAAGGDPEMPDKDEKKDKDKEDGKDEDKDRGDKIARTSKTIGDKVEKLGKSGGGGGDSISKNAK
ncbi:MAG: type IV secretion system protein [Rickettsiaceae bacterium]|nr:type IV secretion system protein [Rickettsiaceae bacterium]